MPGMLPIFARKSRASAADAEIRLDFLKHALCYHQGKGTIMIEDLLQPRHLLLILAVALLFFGPSKLPELGKGLAQGIRSFKDSMKSANPDESVPHKD